ncbi:beta-ketoacyl-ACP synthase [Frateuria aurantia]
MLSTIPSLAITACTATSALGAGLQAHATAIAADRSGLRPSTHDLTSLSCWLGAVAGIDAVRLPERWAHWDSRNHRLAWLGLQQDGFLERVAELRQRHGARRIALLMGTSTASIDMTERAYRENLEAPDFGARDSRHLLHSPHALSSFLSRVLRLEGPAMTVSTACSSSAKVFAHAERLLRLGLVDAAVVGGVDSLCDSVLFGFNSLELVSPEPCRPFDLQRQGISLGEAAGFAILERQELAATAPQLLGYGESSDAWHMSTPRPDGLAAERAVRDALARAGLQPADVGYVNLHGTASQKNDEAEAAMVARVYPTSTRVSSTKGFTGHTLGAAGILEAILGLQVLEGGLIPANLGIRTPDPVCGGHFAWRQERRDIHVVASHSFGFGGSNLCLIFGQGARP